MLSDKWFEYRNDPRTPQQLIELARQEWDMDEIAHPDALTILHFKGSHEVLLATQELCISDAAADRSLGAAILGQLGIPDRTFPDECLETLVRMLERETETSVIADIIFSLGHLRDERVIEPLSRFAGHSDDRVRFSLTFGLQCLENEQAINILVDLMEDPDPITRDWATFAIGSQIDMDTPGIREALFNRLDDEDETVQFEALAGLARRSDTRILNRLVDELASHAYSDNSDLCEGLNAMKAFYTGDPDKLAQALSVCDDHATDDRS